MSDVPFELRYQLSRRQRLVPYLKIWGAWAFVIPFGVVETFLHGRWWSVLLGLVVLWFFRNLFRGLLDVCLRRTVTMDVRVEENALGVLLGGQRWWLFLDGLTRIDKLTAGVWTLHHWNGCVVHIPEEAISESQLAHLRAAMERGRTPEGVRAVIERGRRLEALRRSRFGRE